MGESSRASESELVRTVIGAVSGIVATGPMTAAMIVLHRRLPGYERYPLPPRQITMEFAEKAGVKDKLAPHHRYIAILLAHFGYGAGVGALYGAIVKLLPTPPAITGVLYGLLVWAGSYLGILPVVRVLKPATEHPKHRTALMLGVHVIWGLSLGLLVQIFLREASAPGRQAFSSRGSRLRDVPH